MEHIFLNRFQQSHWLGAQPNGLVEPSYTIHDLIQEGRNASMDCRVLLAPAQSMVLWAGIVSQVMNERWSPNLLPSARALQAAYEMVETYGLTPEENSLLDEACKTFKERCEAQGVCAPVNLVDGLADGVFKGRTFMVHGDCLDVKRRDGLERAGAMLVDAAPMAGTTTPNLYRASSERDALVKAASLVRAYAEASNGEAKIAILHSGDAAKEAALLEVLRAELVPETYLGTRNFWDVPWRLATPPSLLNTSWVELATALLELRSGWNDMLVVSRLLLDRGVLPQTAYSARSKVEWLLRQSGGGYVSMERLVSMLEANGEKTMANALRGVMNSEDWNGTRTFSEWARYFDATLDSFGWLETAEHDGYATQLRQLWDSALEKFSALDVVMGECGRERAVAWLREVCRVIQWQPETEHEQPIVVGSAAALSGLEFDHVIWVDGTTRSVPSSPITNPFIEGYMLANDVMPEATPDGMLESARSHIEQCKSARTFDVLAAAFDERGAMLLPSSLFGNWDSATAVEPAERAPVQRKLIVDPAPPVAAENIQHLKGGTSLLTNAAASPFFALMRNRLHVPRLERTQSGLTASLQGTLVHRVLELFWSAIKTSECLQALSDEALLAAVEQAVDGAFFGDELMPPDRFGNFLVSQERTRITQLVMKWLAHEKARELPFVVKHIEKEFFVEVGGFRMRCKIDRVDEITLASGTKVNCLIDYKTGAMLNTKGWLPENLEDPQLPAYAAFAGEALGMEIDGIAFAQVNEKNIGFSMQSSFTGRLVEDRNGSFGYAVNDWALRKREWESACRGLVDSVMDGITVIKSGAKPPRHLDDLNWFVRNDD